MSDEKLSISFVQGTLLEAEERQRYVQNPMLHQTEGARNCDRDSECIDLD